MTMQRFLGKLPVRFQWTVHNIIAHPVMEVLYQLGLKGLSNRVHRFTVPEASTQETPIDEIDEHIKGLNATTRVLNKGNKSIRAALAKAKADGSTKEVERLTYALERNEAALAKRKPGGDHYRIAHAGFKRRGAFFDGKGGMHESWRAYQESWKKGNGKAVEKMLKKSLRRMS